MLLLLLLLLLPDDTKGFNYPRHTLMYGKCRGDTLPNHVALSSRARLSYAERNAREQKKVRAGGSEPAARRGIRLRGMTAPLHGLRLRQSADPAFGHRPPRGARSKHPMLSDSDSPHPGASFALCDSIPSALLFRCGQDPSQRPGFGATS